MGKGERIGEKIARLKKSTACDTEVMTMRRFVEIFSVKIWRFFSIFDGTRLPEAKKKTSLRRDEGTHRFGSVLKPGSTSLARLWPQKDSKLLGRCCLQTVLLGGSYNTIWKCPISHGGTPNVLIHWKFPKMGAASYHPFWWDFLWNKPAIYWATPFQETSGNPHMFSSTIPPGLQFSIPMAFMASAVIQPGKWKKRRFWRARLRGTSANASFSIVVMFDG